MGKNDFKYLIQKFDKNVLDLVKQKRFHPFEYMSDKRRNVFSFVTGKDLVTKSTNMLLRSQISLK